MQNDSEKYSYSKFPWYALRTSYSDAVSANGGLPILLPFDEEGLDQVLDMIDGLIIPGGDVDIDPSFYGEEIISNTVLTNHQRTSYDLKLLEKTLKLNIPVLGICYGMQLMNVFMGGSLIQDLPEHNPTDINHTQPHPKDAQWHGIDLARGTKLANIAKDCSTWHVNSTHHQAIKKLGQDLIVSATATDGVIEAIEFINKPFAIGVEWHPEYQKNQLDIDIFKALIEHAMI